MEGNWRRESFLLVLDVMGRKWLEWDEKSEKEGGGVATEGLKEVGVVQMPRVVFFLASRRGNPREMIPRRPAIVQLSEV